MADDFPSELLAILPKLRGVARVLARDPAAADDLLQDALLLALAKQHQFTPGTNLAGWMYRLMRNRFISLLRQSRQQAVSLHDCATGWDAVGAEQEEVVERQELQRAMAALPVRQREALTLVYAAGYSYEEAAGMLGCPVGRLKTRILRGRGALQARLLGAAASSASLSAITAAVAGKASSRGEEVDVRAGRGEGRAQRPPV
jgi:RNA polymerase sigma-70 factor (ECF subfamily)